jgi:hypothetical protein
VVLMAAKLSATMKAAPSHFPASFSCREQRAISCHTFRILHGETDSFRPPRVPRDLLELQVARCTCRPSLT